MNRVLVPTPSVARWLAPIALTFTVLGFALQPASAAELVIGAFQSPLSLPITVADEQGYFAAEGVQVRVVDCKSGPQCVQELFDHRVHMALATALVLTLRGFERTDFALVATIATASGHIRVVGRRSAGVTVPERLAGKRIGLLPGTSSQYYLDTFLYFHDVDPALVQFVPLTAENMPTAFATNRIDALASYTRPIVSAMAALGPDGVMFADPRIYTETSNLAVERRTLAERGSEIARVLRALQRAEVFIAAHPDRVKSSSAARTQSGRPQEAEGVLGEYTYRLSLDQSLVSTMEGIARWARIAGHVPRGAKPPNILEVVDAGPLRAAVPTALLK